MGDFQVSEGEISKEDINKPISKKEWLEKRMSVLADAITKHIKDLPTKPYFNNSELVKYWMDELAEHIESHSQL
jgi:hypothetical protein